MLRDFSLRASAGLLSAALAIGCGGQPGEPAERLQPLVGVEQAGLALAPNGPSSGAILAAGIGSRGSRQYMPSLDAGCAEAGDRDSHACPLASEADGDGDGVPDASDACPKEPGIKSSDPKTSGCPARVDAGKIKEKAEITFSGYQSLPGDRGIVFVELTDPVAVEVTRKGQVIEYKLVGASVPLKNNKNPLLLRDFVSSAITVQLVPDKKSVRLVITLRGNAKPSHRMVARGKGAALEVDLPAPQPGVN